MSPHPRNVNFQRCLRCVRKQEGTGSKGLFAFSKNQAKDKLEKAGHAASPAPIEARHSLLAKRQSSQQLGTSTNKPPVTSPTRKQSMKRRNSAVGRALGLATNGAVVEKELSPVDA